jgi:hypothetical protein
MHYSEIEHKKESLIMTTVLFVIVFLLLLFLTFNDKSVTLEELEGGGGGGDIAVNFGNSDFGQGDNYESMEVATPAPKSNQPEKVVAEEIVTDETADDAPAIATTKKPKEQPKKTEKPVEVQKPKPSKSTTDALANILNSSSSKGGDGDDGIAGNKGKIYGDPKATGYNGGGGSGTGTGGGNGSGEGLGSGSGYGNGSGGGRGNGVGNYQLSGRKVLSKPAPKYTCNEEGTVVVEISVNSSGTVTGAIPGVKGTTNTAKCLLDQAKVAAMNTRFDASDNAPDKQVGKIIYNFKLTQ